MITRIRRTLAQLVRTNADLLGVWVVLVVAQGMIPVDHILARDDLAPWLTLTLAVAAFLRGRRYGPGPHPMLTPRKALTALLLRKVAMAATPVVLMAWYEAGGQLSPTAGGLGFIGTIGIIALLAMGGRDGKTAWNPHGSPGGCAWVIGAVLLIGTSVALGWVGSHVPLRLAQWIALSGLVGLAFLAVGVLDGRTQNMRQRRQAGRRDGGPYRLDVFLFALAFLGPGLGLFILLVLFEFFGGLDFNQAYVVSLHVVVWASVVWQRPDPIGRACLLHEVVPTGGSDYRVVETARSFDEAPEGALRFNPLRTRRTRVLHPWVVPVRGSRIAELDDPVRPLWERPPPLLPFHVLGDAAFEPDPYTKATQSDVITIRIRTGQDEDTVQMGGGGGQTRRLVILRAFPAPGTSRRRRMSTYRWESGVPEQSIQLLDASTEIATLRDGDLIVVSSEGVARAYEVEIGAPVYTHAEFDAFRAPQLEDYVKAG